MCQLFVDVPSLPFFLGGWVRLHVGYASRASSLGWLVGNYTVKNLCNFVTRPQISPGLSTDSFLLHLITLVPMFPVYVAAASAILAWLGLTRNTYHQTGLFHSKYEIWPKVGSSFVFISFSVLNEQQAPSANIERSEPHFSLQSN